MRKLALCYLVLALAALTPRATADMVAFSVTSSSSPTARSGANTTFGYTFTLASTIAVTQLGFFDYGGDGLTYATPITIWNARALRAPRPRCPLGPPRANSAAICT